MFNVVAPYAASLIQHPPSPGFTSEVEPTPNSNLSMQGEGDDIPTPPISLPSAVPTPVHYWTLDETSGTRIDTVGALNLSVAAAIGSATGKRSGGANFDGYPNGLLRTAVFDLLTPFSIGFWFKVTTAIANGAQREMVYMPGTAVDSGLEILIENDGGIYTVYGYLGNDGNGDIMAAQYTANTAWHHVMLAVDADGNGVFYFDGALASSGFLSPSTVLGGALAIGKGTLSPFNGTPSPVAGVIDELGIWSAVLTGSQVTALYNSGNGAFYRSR